MATVIVIHGYEGVTDDAWKPWLHQELTDRDITVRIPAMPTPNHPDQTDWVSTITRLVTEADQETPIILVGHSLGGLAVLKFLESTTLPLIYGAIILAGAVDPTLFDPNEYTFVDDWTKLKDWQHIKSKVKHLVGIYSTDDLTVPLVHGQILAREGNARLLVLKEYQHFSAGTSNPKEVPELLQTLDTLIQLAK